MKVAMFLLSLQIRSNQVQLTSSDGNLLAYTVQFQVSPPDLDGV
jgi:hypothetical protein